MLPTFFNSKKKTLSVSQKITSAQLKRRNVDYAHEWAYDTLVSNYRALKDVYSRKHAIAPIMRFFCKRTNQNKLYVWYSRKLFISPGIVVRYAQDVQDVRLKFLKKRSKTWVNTLKAVSPFLNGAVIYEFDNLFGKKEILLKRLVRLNLPNSWFVFKLFFLNFAYGKRPKRRIKRWIKKKYYRLSVNENK